MKEKLTLRRTVNVVAAFVLTSFCLGTIQAQEVKRHFSERKAMRTYVSIPNQKTTPFRQDIPVLTREKSSEENILVSEDFSKFTAGTEDAPDLENVLCNYYGGNLTPYINNSLTHTPGWSGTQVYSAGGTAAIFSGDMNIAACLNTPLGDYSGDLKITLKVKPVSKLAEICVIILKDGIAAPVNADADKSYNSFLFTDKTDRDWQWITVETTNRSADNDGFIQFTAYGDILVDDITVSVKNSGFLAAPNIKKPTNFTANGFIANWEPVRDADDYRFFLYQKEYISDKDSVISMDCENFNNDYAVPEGWTISQHNEPRISIDEGENNSRSIILHDGDTIITPNLNAAYKVFNAWGKAVYPNTQLMEEDFSSIMEIEVYDGQEWKSLGVYMLATFAYDPGLVDFYKDLSTMSAIPCYATRLTFKDFADPDIYFILDNINITTEKPATLVQIPGKDGAYTIVTDTCYQVTELDPETNYYYKVQAHSDGRIGESAMEYAFGIAAPEVTTATNINENKSYTANWNAVPKATRYQVANFGVRKVTADTEEYVILEEHFNKAGSTNDITQPESLGNITEEQVLNNYTNTYGWTGLGNTCANEVIGCEISTVVRGYLQSPILNLSNSDSCRLTIKAYSTYGEQLLITLKDGEQFMLAFDQPNDQTTQLSCIERTITLPCHRSDEQITISAFYGYPFMIDEIKVTQNLKQDDYVYDFLSIQDVEKSSLNTIFSNLDQYNYKTYAFTAWAYLDERSNTAQSDPSVFQHVDMQVGIEETLNETDQNVEIVGYYTITGMQIPSPQKGLNLIRLSNGKVIKKFFD